MVLSVLVSVSFTTVFAFNGEGIKNIVITKSTSFLVDKTVTDGQSKQWVNTVQLQAVKTASGQKTAGEVMPAKAEEPLPEQTPSPQIKTSQQPQIMSEIPQIPVVQDVSKLNPIQEQQQEPVQEHPVGWQEMENTGEAYNMPSVVIEDIPPDGTEAMPGEPSIPSDKMPVPNQAYPVS